VRDTGVYYVIKHEDTSEKVVNSDYYSVAEKRNLKLSKDDMPLPPPPPISEIVYYGNHNFILPESSRVLYFYLEPFPLLCGTGIDFTKPYKLYLMPDSLHELRSEDMQQFLQATILDSRTNLRNTSVSISSPSDTIRNRAFKIITDHLAAKKISSEYVYIRNWTFEEQAVVTAKTQHLGYDPDTLGNHGDYFAAKQIRRRK